MELTEIYELQIENIDEETKDEICDVLIDSNVDTVPKKNLRKFSKICIEILKYENNQVKILQNKIESIQDEGKDDSINERISLENERLTKLINKLEAEKVSLKNKLKEMSDENELLQNRLHDIKAAESDRDSSDPLSELDRQEELLKNISIKNKHIKRLIRDIETLQTQNIEQSKTILNNNTIIQKLQSEIDELKDQISQEQDQNKELNEQNKNLTEKIIELQENVNYLEEEREKNDIELKEFIENLEKRAKVWRGIIDDKENQLKTLRKKFEEIHLQNRSGSISYDSDVEVKELVEELDQRDSIIKDMEDKLKTMTEEMIESTKLMNKISNEREEEKLQNSKKNRSCCKQIEDSLIAANQRCKELSEILDNVEDDNLLKSRQALDAIKALEAYEKGENGLPQALRKISQLQQKLNSRDKQIKALVMEVNSLHEIAQENFILRKRLNIPEDAIISASNLIAKEKSKTKMVDRLNLKLRASEEMRLQLKLEKNDLKKEIWELKNKLAELSNSAYPDENNETQTSVLKPEITTRQTLYCDNCLRNINTMPNPDVIMREVVKEWETKYASVIEENENLRVGMHEILEKIREYDAASDHITIDCSILEKLLHALDARSVAGWYHPAMRMQNELIAVKEKNYALREKMNLVEKSISISQSSQRIATDEGGKKSEHKEDTIFPVEINEETETENPPNDKEIKKQKSFESLEISKIDKISNKFGSDDLYSVLVEKDAENISIKTQYLTLLEKLRTMQVELEELKCYKIQFEELNMKLKNNDDKEIHNYCGKLVDEITEMEIKLKTQEKRYNFLLEDFDRTLIDYKNSEKNNISIISDLKRQLNVKRHEIDLIKSKQLPSNQNQVKFDMNFDNEEMIALKKENLQLRAQLAKVVTIILKERLQEIQIDNEEFCDYGIINENLQLDYMTLDELNRIQVKLQKTIQNYEELKLKYSHVEELLTVSQDQIKSQQKLLSEITDSHIELRHLVADLQSTSDDKFLLAKIKKDLELAKKDNIELQLEKDNIEKSFNDMKNEIQEKENKMETLRLDLDNKLKNDDLKLRFMKKSLFRLHKEYCKFTPLILLVNFSVFYSNVIQKSKNQGQQEIAEFMNKFEESLQDKLEKYANDQQSEELIRLVRYETKCNFYEEQLKTSNEKINELQNEICDLKLSIASNQEHWNAVKILCGVTEEKADHHKNQDKQQELINQDSQETQTEIILKDIGTNTDNFETKTIDQSPPIPAPRKFASIEGEKPLPIDPSITRPVSPVILQRDIKDDSLSVIALQNQLKQAMSLASQRNSLLLECESKLAEAQGRIKEMEKIIENKDQQLKQEVEKISNVEEKAFQRSSNIIESTITSLQSLLSDKDRTLLHYQELLKTEREQHIRSCSNYDTEISTMKRSLNQLNETIKVKDNEIGELKAKIEIFNAEISARKKKSKNLNDDFNDFELDDNENNESNEISDEKIEEMFLENENKNLKNDDSDIIDSERDIDTTAQTKEIQKLQMQLKDIKNRETFWEKSLHAKDEEIAILKEKLALLQEKEKTDAANPEIEQLRILLEEKDKHINDLMETLSNFHEDQQRFINETSIYSTDQVTQLGANLNRCETTNKILTTQIEALRRQNSVLTQREKQTRDLLNSMKMQLIKRPVVSIKSELNSRTKIEQLQKRIHQLENDLDDAKNEIQRQQNLIETKRMKNSIEINLWEKQKKWQQNAEKYRIKLKETETELERTKTLLETAKIAVTRLEKEKRSLEIKLRGTVKCCRTPSCPNLLICHKYNSSPETTDSWAPDTVESLSPRRRFETPESTNNELIDSLKTRIESQQRKIVSLEMEGKCSNTLTSDLERYQEKICALDAQNIRLEAKCLQLQLENDMLRQGNENEKLQKRVRHLEDYILALKEELSQAESQKYTPPQKSERNKTNSLYSTEDAEQTILALRRIIEKLRVENKNLKDGVMCSNSRRDVKIGESTTEISRLQNLYAEALEKISSLQLELQMKKNYCDECKIKILNKNDKNMRGDLMLELKLVKEKLQQKTQLLGKAKILLTRAAAKEKHLKEQIAFWKRKCSELQNVPVIEEISE